MDVYNVRETTSDQVHDQSKKVIKEGTSWAVAVSCELLLDTSHHLPQHHKRDAFPASGAERLIPNLTLAQRYKYIYKHLVSNQIKPSHRHHPHTAHQAFLDIIYLLLSIYIWLSTFQIHWSLCVLKGFALLAHISKNWISLVEFIKAYIHSKPKPTNAFLVIFPSCQERKNSVFKNAGLIINHLCGSSAHQLSLHQWSTYSNPILRPPIK